jgi:hypothetical protein
MSIVSRFWYEKLPSARVDLDPDVEYEVLGSIVFEHLKAKGRIWDGTGEVVRRWEDCDDVPGATIVKVRGEGWYAVV